MVFSVRFNPEERALIEQYAKLHGMTISEVIRKATLEMIEDEMDVEIALKVWEEHQKNPKTYSHEEVKKMLGIL
jgi:predicted DNA-binding protein